MHLVSDTALQLKLRSQSVPRIIENIERSEVLINHGEHTEVLVYWGLQEMSTLTKLFNFNSPLPSPMRRDYSWPGIYKPFDHQRTTSEFLSLQHRAFCFNEAGTGKTSSVIWAADYLMTQGLVKRVLIICPLSIMYSAWQADIFKTAMHRTVNTAHGAVAKREKIINGTYEFVIINYDGVKTVKDAIAKANFDLIVVDEANAYKTVSTDRWKTLFKLLKPSTRLWMLTGTPAAQSPVDAYGLAKLVSPDRVPRIASAWKDKVMMQLTRFKWIPKPSSRNEVFRALQPAIRFAKEDCVDLPEVLYQTRDIPLSTQAMRYYNTLKDDMLIRAAGEQITAVNAAANLNKLLQLSGGAVYTDDGEVVEFDISPRLNALMEVIDETEHKIIVFVPYRHTIDVLKRFLDSKNISANVINGQVSATDRKNIFERFQTGTDPRVLIIQPQAASHGVTLTAANTVVFWSPVMSVETYLQCIARIDRVGQRNKMTVVHLQGSGVEKRIYSMLQGKVDQHEKLVDLYKEVINEV